ncbi:MAG: hypothetical protein IH948_09745 [Bacteroidetes bacterium]|nr:hypothetical protein [Bacteroidota bacterium]
MQEKAEELVGVGELGLRPLVARCVDRAGEESRRQPGLAPRAAQMDDRLAERIAAGIETCPGNPLDGVERRGNSREWK